MAEKTPRNPQFFDSSVNEWKVKESSLKNLYPLQVSLAHWINVILGTNELTADNFFHVLDNGAILHKLARCIQKHFRNLPVTKNLSRCWLNAPRGSFFARDNVESFIKFCQQFGVHENLLFESNDLVLHEKPRQVILCLLELARLVTKRSRPDSQLITRANKDVVFVSENQSKRVSVFAWQFYTNKKVSGTVQTSLVSTTTKTENRHVRFESIDVPNVDETNSKQIDTSDEKSFSSLSMTDENLTSDEENSSLVINKMEKYRESGTIVVDDFYRMFRNDKHDKKSPRILNTSIWPYFIVDKYGKKKSYCIYDGDKCVMKGLTASQYRRHMAQAEFYRHVKQVVKLDGKNVEDKKIGAGVKKSDGEFYKLQVAGDKYNIAGRSILVKLLKNRKLIVRVGGGWDTLDSFLLRHENNKSPVIRSGWKN